MSLIAIKFLEETFYSYENVRKIIGLLIGKDPYKRGAALGGKFQADVVLLSERNCRDRKYRQ